MTIRVELNPATEARLIAEAGANGLPLEKAAEELLVEVLAVRTSARGRMSVEEFHRMLEALAEGSDGLPELPTESFCRASFYEAGRDGGDAVPRR